MSTQYTASGPMAGYLFQIERALYWLAKSKRNTNIAIENNDDISVLSSDEKIIESDKHSTSNSNPFGERSVSLWKSLYIWIDLIDNERVDIEKTKFFLVTNKIVNSTLVNRLGNPLKNKNDIEEILILLKNICNSPSKTIEKYTTKFNSKDEDLLKRFLKNIELIDGKATAIESLHEQIADVLHIPPIYDDNHILNEMIGWITNTCLLCWRNKEAAIISRSAFDKYLWGFISELRIKKFRERTKDMIFISSEDKEESRNKIFIKQILLIAEDNNQEEYVLDAIDDYLCSRNEWSRLAQEGDISGVDYTRFIHNLEERWKNLKQRIILLGKKENNNDMRVLGEEIYLETLEYKGMLAGQQTEEYYLTKGSYHDLADYKRIGWHPRFNEILEGKDSAK